MKLTKKEIKEVEQTMERYEIAGVSELDYIIANRDMVWNECKKVKEQLRQAKEIIDNPGCVIFQQGQLIDSLEKQLAEKDKLLENAIVPKFAIGQYCYLIRVNEVLGGFYIERDTVLYMKFENNEWKYWTSFWGTSVPCGYPESQLFATKSEAEKQLEKLQ